MNGDILTRKQKHIYIPDTHHFMSKYIQTDVEIYREIPGYIHRLHRLHRCSIFQPLFPAQHRDFLRRPRPKTEPIVPRRGCLGENLTPI